MSLISIAQKYDDLKYKKWALIIGVNLHRMSVTDKVFTAIPYIGYNLGGSAGINLTKEKSEQTLRVSYTNGTLQTNSHLKKKLTNSHFNFDYDNLYNIVSTREFIYNVGGGLNIFYASRNYSDFINNNYSYDFAASLSAAMKFSYLLQNRLSGFVISDQISIPVISSILQPDFGGDSRPGNTENNNSSLKDFLKDNRVVSFASFFRIVNNLSVKKNLSKSGALSFCYLWDYYHFSSAREVKQANHCLELTYSFIF